MFNNLKSQPYPPEAGELNRYDYINPSGTDIRMFRKNQINDVKFFHQRLILDKTLKFFDPGFWPLW